MMQSLRRCKQRASITLGWQRALRCVAFIAWRFGLGEVERLCREVPHACEGVSASSASLDICSVVLSSTVGIPTVYSSEE